jgi:hypothetical protein
MRLAIHRCRRPDEIHTENRRSTPAGGGFTLFERDPYGVLVPFLEDGQDRRRLTGDDCSLAINCCLELEEALDVVESLSLERSSTFLGIGEGTFSCDKQ